MSKKKPTSTSESCSKPTFEENSCSSENSFLKEMSFNSIIDDAVRKEIEKKYKKSKVNSCYVFPRKAQKKQSDKDGEKDKKRTPVKPKHRYCASNLPLGKSLPVLHRSSKSACASALYANHLKTIKKKVLRSTSCKKSAKEAKVLSSGRQTPAAPHKRSASQNSKRPKTPACKEARLDTTCKRTKFRNKERMAEGKGDGRGDGRGEGKALRDSKGYKDMKGMRDVKGIGDFEVKDLNGVVRSNELKKPRQLFSSMDQGFPNYIMKSLVEY